MVRLRFIYTTTQIWWHLAITRRKLPIWASLKKFLGFLLWSPGMLRLFIPHLLQWFKPGYHPSNDHKAPAERRAVRRHIAALEAKAVPVSALPPAPVSALPSDSHNHNHNHDDHPLHEVLRSNPLPNENELASQDADRGVIVLAPTISAVSGQSNRPSTQNQNQRSDKEPPAHEMADADMRSRI